jgi:hypothetical protein
MSAEILRRAAQSSVIGKPQEFIKFETNQDSFTLTLLGDFGETDPNFWMTTPEQRTQTFWRELDLALP